MRFRVPKELHTRYVVVCKELDLSIPKQCAQIIEKFVDVHEDNIRIQKHLKRMKKE